MPSRLRPIPKQHLPGALDPIGKPPIQGEPGYDVPAVGEHGYTGSAAGERTLLDLYRDLQREAAQDRIREYERLARGRRMSG